MYTVTPHTVTGISPAELMFGRRFKDKFPHFSDEVVVSEEVQESDLIAKYQAKLYRDTKVHAKPSDIRVGDQVLMKNQQRDNKLAPNFNPEPAVVMAKAGNSVTVRTSRGEVYRRNSCHLKPIATAEQELPNIEGEAFGNTEFQTETPAPTSERVPIRKESPGEANQPRPKRNIKPPARFKDYDLGDE